MNIPNLLSICRLILVPCFAVVYLSSMKYSGIIAGLIFVVAALTDVVDGHLARKWKQVTKFGRIIDPLADKLLQVTALACLTLRGVMSPVLLIIFLTKEALMLAGAMFMVNRLDDVMPSNWYGKAVSFLVSFTICAAIFFYDLINPHYPRLFPIMFTAVTILAISALIIYLIMYIRCLRRKNVMANVRDRNNNTK